MITAETVQHLHSAMHWDFQVILATNLIFFLILVFLIVSKK